MKWTKVYKTGNKSHLSRRNMMQFMQTRKRLVREIIANAKNGVPKKGLEHK